LDGAGGSYVLKHVSYYRVLQDKISKNEYGLILFDEISDDAASNIDENTPSFILIAGRDEEKRAVLALEQGWIADYVLNSPSGLKRLPLVLRAVLARSQSQPYLENLHFFYKT
jgi:DNA-binding response OmpR family regulator